MRKAVIVSLLGFFAAPLLCAQPKDSGFVTVTPQQCVWRTGDNPAWSSADLDEAGWQPDSSWRVSASESRIWIRCHLDSAAFRESDSPGVQVRLPAAYELFLNGAPIGRNGDLRSGFFTMDSIRIFSFSPSLAASGSNLLSLRIVYRFAPLSVTDTLQTLELRLGGMQALRDNRAGALVSLLPYSLTSFAPMVVLGIAGLVLLGFSVPDRKNPEPILLGLSCVFLGVLFVDILCGSMMTSEPVWAYIVIWCFGSTANSLTQVSFYFALARKRIPVSFRLFIIASIAGAAWPLVELLLPAQAALRLDLIHDSIVDPGYYILLAIILGCGPFVAFWPYRRIPARMRAVAGLSAAWGAVLLVFFLTLASNYIPGAPNFFHSWQSVLFPVQSIVQASVVAGLIALVVREQRQIADQRSALAGEMEAAQRMQRALIPASIDSLPGLKIDVAFSPAREVGGDFYSCRILPAGHQRILLGDVSGKGAAAAMTAAVLLGASERRDEDSPAELLRHLNLVLSDMHLGGFATCLCAHISADGSLTLANAGHLAPYHNGDEIPALPCLPLGITVDTACIESILSLAPGDTVTFVSDGVVEATSPTGELFGFDRTRAISRKSAESIAQTAQAFGQEDDITVLTLTFDLAAGLKP